MKKTLYIKLLLAYVIFAVFGLIVVATFMQQMTMSRLQQDNAQCGGF